MPFDTSPARQPGPSFFTVAREIVAHQEARRAAHPNRGVCWSAMTSPAPEVETVEAVAARLERQAEERRAFRASPRGRVLTAIEALEADYPAEANALRTHYAHFYYSGFGRPGERVQTDAIGRALRVLAPMDCAEAQAVEEAIAELLIADGKLAEVA